MMRTIGQIFREARESKNLLLSDVEKATKIRKIYLQALENGEYQKLPPSAFIRGFVHNYSEFLGLKTGEILALFRREFDQQNDQRLLPKDVSKTEVNIFFLTPHKISLIFIGLLLVVFTIYIIFQLRLLSGGPYLIVQSPQDNLVVSDKEFIVAGKTDPDATLKINGQTIQNLEGKFHQELTLGDGLNTIQIEAVSRNGKTTRVERHIRLFSE